MLHKFCLDDKRRVSGGAAVIMEKLKVLTYLFDMWMKPFKVNFSLLHDNLLLSFSSTAPANVTHQYPAMILIS